MSRLRRWVAVVVAVFLPAAFGACSSTDTKCADAVMETAGRVAGVVSVEYSCIRTPEGTNYSGEVVVDTESRQDAIEIMVEVLHAMAADGRLDDTIAVPSFVTSNGSLWVSPYDLDPTALSGTRSLGEIRDYLGIEPGSA